ncbi:hypothetical protein [Streptomyces sp. 1222.5]|uniref:hypothetical protein n=1 Tax=Streptomyces sp. 1222.5 TaxID=1881026 RepID=UPI003D72E8C2
MSESVQDGTERLKHTAGTARQEASVTTDQAMQAAGQVTSTAAEGAKAVAGEARQQVGTVLDGLRSRAVEEAQGQAQRATGVLRQWSDDIAGLADNAPGESPARSLACQVAQGGHRAADYIEKQGVDRALSDLRRFARQRPGAFLGGALLTGLVVGRLARAGGKARQASGSRQHDVDAAAALEAGHASATPTLPTGSGQQAPPMPPVPPAVPKSADLSETPQAPPPTSPPPTGTAGRPFPEV